MATPRKTTVTTADKKLFVRTTKREPFRPEQGQRFDRVTITYRPHGFWADMIQVFATHDAHLGRGPAVDIKWTTGGRDQAEPDDWAAARCFFRAMRDALSQAEALRQHMGVTE